MVLAARFSIYFIYLLVSTVYTTLLLQGDLLFRAEIQMGVTPQSLLHGSRAPETRHYSARPRHTLPDDLGPMRLTGYPDLAPPARGTYATCRSCWPHSPHLLAPPHSSLLGSSELSSALGPEVRRRSELRYKKELARRAQLRGVVPAQKVAPSSSAAQREVGAQRVVPSSCSILA